jgi:hypothetical protein
VLSQPVRIEWPGAGANPAPRGWLLAYSTWLMWALTRLGEFNRLYQSAADTWDRSEVVANLQFAHGLMFSFLLVAPFWTAVGLLLHHLAK